MGKCEISTASVGLKIQLSQLISQINKQNFSLIKNILLSTDAFIADQNDNLNQIYIENIIESENIYDIVDHDEFQNYITYKLKTGEINIYNEYLLFPINTLLKTSRWGYDRYGINGNSINIDSINLKINKTEYSKIKNYSIVFILSQHSS